MDTLGHLDDITMHEYDILVNILRLYRGESLIDPKNFNDKYKIVNIDMANQYGEEVVFDLEDIANLISEERKDKEKISKLEKEIIMLTTEINKLKAKEVESEPVVKIVSCKPHVCLNTEEQDEVVKYYVDNKPISVTKVAEKFNISNTYCSKILDKYGVRYIKHRNR